MSDADYTYDVLSELYFVTSFSELKSNTEMETKGLIKILLILHKNGWLRCYHGIDNEIEGEQVDIQNLFDKYHYLASKDGLFAHNTR